MNREPISEAGFNKRDEYWETPLSWAAKNGYLKVVKLLLDADAKVDSSDVFGQTPLIWAAAHGTLETVKLLFAALADLIATKRTEEPQR